MIRQAARRDPLTTFHDDDFNISLQYPWQYGFKSGHKLQTNSTDEVPSRFVAPGGVNLGTIDVPAGYYAKTDFERAFLTINVHRKLTQDECGQFAAAPADREEKDSGRATKESANSSIPQFGNSAVPQLPINKVTLGQHEYLMSQEEPSEDTTLRTYHTYQNGACYEFALGLKTSDRDGSGADNAQTIKPASQKQVFARLEKVLATVDIARNAENGTAVAGIPVPSEVPQKP